MSEYVRVELRGEVVPESSEARARLSAQTGRFYLEPSSSDLLVGLRTPAQGGSSKRPRVALAGDISAMPMADVIAFLNQARMTGVLQVLAPGAERAIALKNGEVRGAASDAPADKLGEIAVRLGYINRAQLDKVLATRPAPGRLGRALVDAGVLQSHDLWKCMQHQVGEIVYGVLICTEGAFAFIDQEIEERTSVSMSTQGLLMDAIRRIDEMKEFRKRLPSSEAFVYQTKAPPRLEPHERTLFDLCNGERTVVQIAQGARLSEFEATKALHHLITLGCVQVSSTPRPTTVAKPTVGPREVLGAFNAIFRLVFSEVARHGAPDEFAVAARAALEGQASKLPWLERLAFSPDGVLPDEPLLGQLGQVEGTPADHARLLREALSELMFFLLFETGERLEAKVNDALAERAKEMLAAVPGD